MSDSRGIRDEPGATQKRNVDEPSSSEYGREGIKAKTKAQEVFSTKKIDGFGDSLSSSTSNLNDVKYGSFGEDRIGMAYIPSLSDLNDNSELQELSFLNLQGVCQAEKDILHKIIHNSQWYSDTLFCFMRSPSPDGPNVIDIDSDRCLTEVGGNAESDGIPEVSGDPDNASGHISDETTHIQQNGPAVDVSHVSQPQITPVNEGNIPPAVMNQGVPPANMRSYYPPPPHLAVSTTGPGQTMPPSSVQIPVSGGQMVMYPQQMQQLMQTGHGGYPMQVGYPPLQYGFPQHGGQPHVTYVSPAGEPMSPESVHMAPQPPHGHQKGHHEGHHGIPHTSTTSGSGGGGYVKSRNHRRDNVKQQQPYYYPSYGYAPGVQYHSHQQLAQNLQGSPIIMPAPGNIYSYHQPPPPMYPPNPAAGEMEHHPSVGMSQSMSHMTSELPPYAQHHHVPPMYHHSPTHSGNRVGSYSQSSRVNPIPTAPVEQPTSTTIEHEVDGNGDKSEIDISQHSVIAAGSNSRSDTSEPVTGATKGETENSQKMSQISGSSPTVSPDSTFCEPSPVVHESNKPSTDTAVVESLLEPPRDTDPARRLTPMSEKVSLSSSKGASDGGTGNLVDSQIKGTSSENQEKETNYKNETLSLNGEVRDIKMGKGVPRDKISAEPTATNKKDNTIESRQPGHANSKLETKSKSLGVSVNNNARSVNVVPDSSLVLATSSTKDDIDTKLESESASGEFPQLSSNNNVSSSSSISSNIPTNSSLSGSSSGTTSVAAKGRSWASIASVKLQSAISDGAIQNSKRFSTASTPGLDQGSGDGLTVTGASKLSGGEQQYCNFVPSSQFDKALAKSTVDSGADIPGVSDDNDPTALVLGEFLRNYTLDHHSIALTPRGLCNQGNYCYINATLQSLLACPPFVNLFRGMGDILNKKSCRATPIIQSVFELVKEFEPLLRGNANKKERMKDVFNVGVNLEPIGIRKCLGLLEGNTFKVEGRQEDAEEFLSHLLNGLHDEMLRIMKSTEQPKEKNTGKSLVPPSSSGQGTTNGGMVEVSGDEDDDQWQVIGAKNKSCLTRKTAVSKTPISEAFLGQMCYFYRESSTGNHKSATLQPFYTLQLDIQNDNIRSVRDALEAISAREEVSGVVSNGCEIEAWRQLSLEELPVVLILHLKRFVYEKNGNKIRKIDKKLDFSIDIEIGKEMLSPTAKSKYTPRQRQYKLFGVVYHDGEEAHKGHYVADCFHASGGSMWGQCGWLRFDDTTVKQIPESQMLNPQPPRVPYLLYYRRGDTLLSHVTQQQQQQHKKDRP